jgi:hypothetical protein
MSSDVERMLFGISRVALFPNWWQPVQPSVLTICRIHSPWLRMFWAMPLPPAPVPGKSLFGGSCSIENQYCAG